jgi:hypothetical protein
MFGSRIMLNFARGGVMVANAGVTQEDERRLVRDVLEKAKQLHKNGSLEISSIDDFTCWFTLDGLAVAISRCKFNTRYTITVETQSATMIAYVYSPDFPWFAKLWNLAGYFSDRRPQFVNEKRNARYAEISSRLARV